MILIAETYENCVATLCLSNAKKHEAENILIISRLPKTVETQNLDDKVSCYGEVGTRKILSPVAIARRAFFNGYYTLHLYYS